ncbi:MAG: hypothetical protein IKJ68_02195 [Clostridia bacterium]|nr:hypothetical protein [Clostridia bacterium]
MSNSKDNIKIQIMSFGYKYGMPDNANFLQDVRFLPNPYYDEKLKHKSGLDADVREYVKQTEQSKEYINKLKDFAEFYIHESFVGQKGEITFAIGCTGGRHRSVTVARELYTHLISKGYSAEIFHRDIKKDE